MYAINETLGVSFLIPAVKCDFNLNSTEKGILSAITFVGMMTSSHFWGYISDTKGRRRALLLTVGSSIIVSIISVFMNNFWIFILCRFLVGFL
jgi:MFS family permease